MALATPATQQAAAAAVTHTGHWARPAACGLAPGDQRATSHATSPATSKGQRSYQAYLAASSPMPVVISGLYSSSSISSTTCLGLGLGLGVGLGLGLGWGQG